MRTQSAENRRKKCHRFWLRLRHARILISNVRSNVSLEENKPDGVNPNSDDIDHYVRKNEGKIRWFSADCTCNFMLLLLPCQVQKMYHWIMCKRPGYPCYHICARNDKTCSIFSLILLPGGQLVQHRVSSQKHSPENERGESQLEV